MVSHAKILIFGQVAHNIDNYLYDFKKNEKMNKIIQANPADLKFTMKSHTQNQKLKFFCDTCPYIHKKPYFNTIRIKMLSHIKILIFGQVAHFLCFKIMHIEKPLISAGFFHRILRKIFFFEKSQNFKMCLMCVKKIKIFSNFT